VVLVVNLVDSDKKEEVSAGIVLRDINKKTDKDLKTPINVLVMEILMMHVEKDVNLVNSKEKITLNTVSGVTLTKDSYKINKQIKEHLAP